jgi:hypothetical protein
MNTPVKITGTARAWTTNKWTGCDEVQAMAEAGKMNEAVSSMQYTLHDMSGSEDWNEVGTAEITVTFFARDVIALKELEALHGQLQKVRADNAMRENAILDRISKLQALEYTE